MSADKTVAFYTLGCKLNFSETSAIARQFEELGYARVDAEHRPDIVVINTCSVTENADRKCRQCVSKALHINPESFVIVVGCYAQLKPVEISQIKGVDLVLGAHEKFNVSRYLNALEKRDHGVAYAEDIRNPLSFVPSHSAGDRTRTFLKIQDGCDYFCSFCTIPLARGKSRNAGIKDTLDIIMSVSQSGVKEIVLTGINIGDFGQGSNENFTRLILEIEKLRSPARIRLSSIEPDLLTEEIIACVAQSSLFMPHFHIPLQSGSDILLKSMRRKYDTTLYRKRINLIKSMMPHACIGADVIVGYPGETEFEFAKTQEFLKSLDLSYLHVFTYSERNNTTARKLNGTVAMDQRRSRSRQLQSLSEKFRRKFYDSQLNSVQQVLWEAPADNGTMSGFTGNYVRVKKEFDSAAVNTIESVLLEKADHDSFVLVSPLEIPV